jgi:hypothetical protein
MTTYTTPNGSELVVCDGCGIDHDGNKPDVSRLKKAVDETEELRAHLSAAGFDPVTVKGCAIKVSDYCPDCKSRRNAK